MMDRLLSTALMFAVGLALASAARAGDDPAFAAAARMGNGVNILGYDGIWEGGVDAPFRLDNLRIIRRAGFGHVRINLFAFKFMDAADELGDAYLRRLDRVIGSVVSAGLVPVIDEHDTDTCQSRITDCRRKLASFWRQVAARYAGTFPTLIFEILNEPGGDMSFAQWNDLTNDMLAIIRSSNPDRIVIVGTLNTPDASIDDLRLPEGDRRLIVTFHYYKPFEFTHQGAPWEKSLAALPTRNWGSAAERDAVTDDFARVAAWAKREKRPVYLGEFGVYERAPASGRQRYLGFVARTATRFGWPWAYWQFDHDFALFDEASQRWHRDMLRALDPGRAQPN